MTASGIDAGKPGGWRQRAVAELLANAGGRATPFTHHRVRALSGARLVPYSGAVPGDRAEPHGDNRPHNRCRSVHDAATELDVRPHHPPAMLGTNHGRH